MSSATSPTRFRPLRIDTSHAAPEPATTRISTDTFVVPPTPTPSFLISSPTEPNPNPPTPVSPSFQKAAPDPYRRVKFESRKLLAHVLDQLQSRPMPPKASSTLTRDSETGPDTRLGALMATVTGVVKFKQGRKEIGQPMSPTLDDESEDEDEDTGYSNETTYNLMLQLKDVLAISKAQGLDIFDVGDNSDGHNEHNSTGFRRSKGGLGAPGRRSPSPSPAFSAHIRAPKLLAVCISILASVVLEDCRYKIASPRPTRPPNALQLLTLEIAQYLIYSKRHDPKIVAEIGFAMLPAFVTFHSDMHFRLLAFFEGAILRRAIEGIVELQDIESGKHVQNYLTQQGDMGISIQVDEVPDESTGAPKWQSWPTNTGQKVLSVNAPKQSEVIYHFASLVPALLSSIIENVDSFVAWPRERELHQRLRSLFDMVVRSKLDAYTDFLQVIAYHTPKARRAATSLTLAYWRRVVGHVTVSHPHNHLSSPTSTRPNDEDERLYAHQFVPWRFASRTSSKSSHGIGTRPYDCRVCLQGVHDFGLLCPWCMSAVHFDCYDYPAGNQIIEYSMATNEHTKRVVMYRFSPTLGNTLHDSSPLIRKSKHLLRTITTFTLCLCFGCRTPLWGCSNQGLQCISCSQFFHSHCINGSPIDQLSRCDRSEITSEHMVIEWSSLRSSCVSHYSDIFALAEQELGSLSFEELSILHGVLWTQLQLLTSGIAMGSIIVMHRGKSAAHTKDNKVDDFELHRVIQWCEAYLLANNQPCSPAMEDYLSEYPGSKRSPYLMFDWSTLTYITSSMRSREYAASGCGSSAATSNLLNVVQADVLVDDSKESLEIAPLSHLRNSLGYEFGIHSDIAAKHLLSHLHHLGFFTKLDGGVDLFRADEGNHVQCVFGLPLGFDKSTDVEILASAIEACLSDLDLAVNEVGLLLLARRFWPNAMLSDYALRRLSRGLVYWILAEDNNLATILKDYIAKQKALPGVRPANGPSSWPAAQSARPTPVSSVNNGGDYVAARRMLLLRYAAPWLLQLHDQDTRHYSSILQHICLEYAQDKVGNLDQGSEGDRTRHALALCEALLHAITRLSQTSVTFSIFNDLFIGWMDLVSSYSLLDEPIPSLSRLFPRDADGHQRTSTMPDPSTAQPDSLNFAVIDPWRVVMAAANKSKNYLSRSLRWLRIFANCGIDIPDPTLLRFANLLVHFDSGIEDALMLTTSALSSLWLKSLGRQRLQRLFSILHTYLAEHITECLQGVKQDSETTFVFVRRSLGGCLLLYGCDRESIVQSGLILQTEIEKLPSRRKLGVRAMPHHDPILIDSELLGVLGRYMAAGVDDMSCILATFLDILLAGSSLFESYEMDNFILQNGVFLSTCAWSLYGLQHHPISSVRTRILLRTLVVDPQPFQEIITGCFQVTEQWERRLLAVTQLFRIILDVISPAFSIEDRQWRSSVVDVFFHFFSSMWADEQEEVRLTAQTLSQTLLPAHFETIAACWTESLLKAPFDERVKLVSFLTQLHPHFPSWKVLSWDAILEVYNSEGVQPVAPRLGKTGVCVDKPRSAANDKEMINLRVSMMILALQLVADGIPIDRVTLAHLKFNLCRILGFPDVSAVPTRDGLGTTIHFGEINEMEEHAISCVDELVQILDSTHHTERYTTNASSASGQTQKSLSATLVGTPFVDMTLALFYSLQDLSNLPVLTTKNLLEAVCIIIYKHDFEEGTLRHQQQSLKKAVLRSLELMLQEVSFEVRQLALSVVQAFVKRWSKIMGSTVYAAFESTAKLIASQSHHGQDALVLQGKRFIEATLSTYSEHGLLANLLKRPLDRDFFVILKQILEATTKQSAGPSLRTALFRDTFFRLAAIDVDQSVLQVILNNLQSLIEIVHHVDYDHDLVLAVGQCLISIAKRVQSEGATLEFDATGLLLVPALLIQHNKVYSRDILAYTETLLRIALTRLNVLSSCLIELLTVTGDLYRKFATESTPTNPVALIIFDILGDSLRSKTRVLPLTLKALVEAVTSEEIARILEINPSLNLTDHGIQFLYSHVWLSSEDFAASMAVARMILRGARHDPTVVGRFASYTLDKSSRQIQVVRAWNILLLAAMQDTEGRWSNLLFSHLAAFAAGHQNVLRWYAQPEVVLPETALTDINHAYISLKLWVMVAKYADKDTASGNVWQDLWPPFEALVDSLDKQPNLPSTFTTLVSSSIADLFLFLATLHTPLSLQTSLHAALLNKLKHRGRGDTTSSKVTRALRAITDPPPIVPLDGLVDQIGMEIMAAEKLRMLETRRNINTKIAHERR